jgi:Zn-dependent protease with chaperone function
MTRQDQCTIAGAIYGAIALLFLCAFGAGLYGLFHGGPAGLVPVSALFGLFGFMAMFASFYCFRKALA